LRHFLTMHLSSLRLRNFRRFEALQCPLPSGMTVFMGDNAQGKTSLLEAACVLLRLQSPRTQKIADCIRFGATDFGVAGTLDARELRHLLRDGKRQLFAGGVPVAKAADFLQASGLVVWMGNGDMELVSGASDSRRRYLDFLGSQMFPEYRPALGLYEKALRSRNFLLKRDARPDWRQIDAFTSILDEKAKILTALRERLVEILRPHAAAAHASISRDGEALGVEYSPAGGRNLAESLTELREEEMRRRVTATGPHRDDFQLALDDRPATQFASEGQQRTISLALKLAQATVLRETHHCGPLLLIDDIFGELDPGRRNALMAALPRDAQRIVTTTRLDWLRESTAPDAIFHVHGGAVHPV
jgi:DNA replication and repair protein RecF